MLSHILTEDGLGCKQINQAAQSPHERDLAGFAILVRFPASNELHRGSDYILHALKLGISSRNTVAGTGLFQIQQQILDASGTLAIRSQHSRVIIDNGTLHVQDNLVHGRASPSVAQ